MASSLGHHPHIYKVPEATVALRGDPSRVWRCGQERRLGRIRDAAHTLDNGIVLVDGTGLGLYAHKLSRFAASVHGLEIEFDNLANQMVPMDLLVCGSAEDLPYPECVFDIVLSHEVLEHVDDDEAAASEIVRVLRVGGRGIIFAPNRWYPFETHGAYWGGEYHFGNIPLLNYLPSIVRNRLAPHVRAYTKRGLLRLFDALPVHVISHCVIYGGYDNIIARFGTLGRLLRAGLYLLEDTSLQCFGLSHFLVIEKT